MNERFCGEELIARKRRQISDVLHFVVCWNTISLVASLSKMQSNANLMSLRRRRRRRRRERISRFLFWFVGRMWARHMHTHTHTFQNLFKNIGVLVIVHDAYRARFCKTLGFLRRAPSLVNCGLLSSFGSNTSMCSSSTCTTCVLYVCV